MQSTEVKRELGKQGVLSEERSMVGSFLRMDIGLTKSALKKVLGRQHISLTILETVIETALND